MKKSLFFIPLALGLFACSNDNVVDSTDKGENSEVEYSYLSVKIVPAQSTSTRDDQFVNGIDDENEVSSIRFYFFDQDGKSVAVRRNNQTHLDVKGEDLKDADGNSLQGSVNGNDNVESNISSILVIESPDDRKPYYMAAVLNVPDGNLPVLSVGEGIEELQKAADYSASTKGSFVISSTAYATLVDDRGQKLTSGNGTIKEWIAEYVFSNIVADKDLAKTKPATLYVERVLAKVSAEVDFEDSKKVTANGKTIYKTGTQIDKGGDKSTEDIYVDFLGWNVTAKRTTSRLIKKVDPQWQNPFENWAENEPWSEPGRFRSYWAINPESDDYNKDYLFGNFGTGNVKDANSANALSLSSGSDYTYLQENAGKADDGLENGLLPSKIIVAAQLVDKNGMALELAEWAGEVYLIDQLLDELVYYSGVYKLVDGEWKSITEDDIVFVQTKCKGANQAYNSENEDYVSPRYYVNMTVKDGETYGFYNAGTIDKGENDKGYTAAQLKEKHLDTAVGDIKVWTSGYTYYWVDIRHLATKEGTGYYGVVRNHWYKYSFNSVKGLGVPVFNPNDIIYPEIPEDPEKFYLAAEIKILTWRIVPQLGQELGW